MNVTVDVLDKVLEVARLVQSVEDDTNPRVVGLSPQIERVGSMPF